jgi:hypothetical protein
MSNLSLKMTRILWLLNCNHIVFVILSDRFDSFPRWNNSSRYLRIYSYIYVVVNVVGIYGYIYIYRYVYIYVLEDLVDSDGYIYIHIYMYTYIHSGRSHWHGW